MKVYSSKSVQGQLDKIVGEFYRSKPCVKCGSKHYVQWCHCRSRRYLITRWEKLNCLSLCAKCHYYFHDNPHEFSRWLDIKYPDRIEKLTELSQDVRPIKKYDMEQWLEEWKGVR